MEYSALDTTLWWVGGLIMAIFLALTVHLDAKNLQLNDVLIYQNTVKQNPHLCFLLAFCFQFIYLVFYLFKRNAYCQQVGNPLQRNVSEEKNAFIEIAQSCFIIFASLCAVPAMQLLLNGAMLFGLRWETLEYGLYLFLSSIGVFWVVTFVSLAQNASLSFSKMFEFNVKGKNVFDLYILPFVLAITFLSLVLYFINARGYSPHTELKVATEEASGQFYIVFLILATTLAPIYEELLYRGVFYKIVERSFGEIAALILVTLVFWASHVQARVGDSLEIVTHVFAGFLFTYLRYWSKSIIPGIVAHYTYNIGNILFYILLSF